MTRLFLTAIAFAAFALPSIASAADVAAGNAKFQALCVSCHGPGGKGDGPTSDHDFGREQQTGKSEDRFKFRTPTLLNLQATGPYSHTGTYSLEDAASHYFIPEDTFENRFPGADANPYLAIAASLASGLLGFALGVAGVALMGRVDQQRHHPQAGQLDSLKLPYHKMILADEIPLSIGGGIGQSRTYMYFLRKAHLGEVSVTVWPKNAASPIRTPFTFTAGMNPAQAVRTMPSCGNRRRTSWPSASSRVATTRPSGASTSSSSSSPATWWRDWRARRAPARASTRGCTRPRSPPGRTTFWPRPVRPACRPGSR